MPHLLIIAYEYFGYHSRQGTALARRITQVAESFLANGWNVTVIHKDHLDQSGTSAFTDNIEPNGIRRIAVKETFQGSKLDNIAPLRRLLTFYYLLVKGDRTFKFGQSIIDVFDQLNIPAADLLISFYTPRGTIYAAQKIVAKHKMKWIADIQDPLKEGLSSPLSQQLGYKWAKKALHDAHALVHVSPEWANDDSKKIGRSIEVIRHAIPSGTTEIPLPHAHPQNQYTILYAGSLDPDMQSADILNEVLSKVDNKKQIRLLIAANENVYNYFKKVITANIKIEHTGWLDYDAYRSLVGTVDCNLVLPWFTQQRVGIPSKFYDLCQFSKPIWLVGRDSGGFTSLLKEWQHPQLATGNIDIQLKALEKAISGDYSGMFVLATCGNKPLYDNDICHEYLRLI